MYCAHGVALGGGAIGNVYRVEGLRFLRADRMCVETGRRLHGDEREQLEQMVRDHVAQGARCIVESPAPPDR